MAEIARPDNHERRACPGYGLMNAGAGELRPRKSRHQQTEVRGQKELPRTFLVEEMILAWIGTDVNRYRHHLILNIARRADRPVRESFSDTSSDAGRGGRLGASERDDFCFQIRQITFNNFPDAGH